MPVPPAELTAEYAIKGSDEAAVAARAVAARSGLARDAGPGVMALTGSRAEVLATLDAVLEAALDAGAHEIDLRLIKGQTP
jgi:hypothetical protein